jgi:NAD-reducing hydrogenase large subunit
MRKITIEPVTRVEGHGKVTIHVDDRGRVVQTYLHIVEFRGFERFIQGRPYWEMPVLVQRLCGICPVSHHLCASKAVDLIVGVGTEGLSPTAEKVRRLMHYGQMLQSHALHFFHLASPDLLLGIDSDPALRNVIGVALHDKQLATMGVMMRKFGQELILATAGKKIHGTGAIPGGVNKNLSIAERDRFFSGELGVTMDQVVDWAGAAVQLFRDYHRKHTDLVDGFAHVPSSHLSIVRKDGALDFYHGVLRAVDADGHRILHDIDYREYLQYIDEEVRPWTYMKFPYLLSLGKEKGWYRVGPLARLNTCDFIPSPLAQKEFEHFRSYSQGKPNHRTLHTHWARLIELLHAAEVIRELLRDPDLQGTELVRAGTPATEGIGFLEAPRGTLIHHYRVNAQGQVAMANLIVSTAHNNQPMNESVRAVAEQFISGNPEVTEGMLNAVEVAIRAYDPCLSCATHALGKMPLGITILGPGGRIVAEGGR